MAEEKKDDSGAAAGVLIGVGLLGACLYTMYWFFTQPSPPPPPPTTCEAILNPTDCLANDCFWYNDSCHPIGPTCEILDNETDCLANGCFWYDGACHSVPEYQHISQRIFSSFNISQPAQSNHAIIYSISDISQPAQTGYATVYSSIEISPGATSAYAEVHSRHEEYGCETASVTLNTDYNIILAQSILTPLITTNYTIEFI